MQKKAFPSFRRGDAAGEQAVLLTGIHHFPPLPGMVPVDMEKNSSLQRRDRAGMTPASLLSFCKDLFLIKSEDPIS